MFQRALDSDFTEIASGLDALESDVRDPDRFPSRDGPRPRPDRKRMRGQTDMRIRKGPAPERQMPDRDPFGGWDPSTADGGPFDPDIVFHDDPAPFGDPSGALMYDVVPDDLFRMEPGRDRLDVMERF